MTETGERDPVLSDTAAVLEDLIAFEGRARNLHMRWNDASIAGGTTHPFLTPGGEARGADLRTLKADLPRHAVMLSSLQQASRGTRSPRGADPRNGRMRQRGSHEPLTIIAPATNR